MKIPNWRIYRHIPEETGGLLLFPLFFGVKWPVDGGNEEASEAAEDDRVCLLAGLAKELTVLVEGEDSSYIFCSSGSGVPKK